MPSAWTQNLYHAVFGTKLRQALIDPELEPRLHAFLGGIARDLKCQAIAINGIEDHVHCLIRYPSDLAHSVLIRHLKARSSRWVHENFANRQAFAWQNGYGGFTVSKSGAAEVEAYIRNQKVRHRTITFTQEFLALLRKHEIDFDEATVFE